MTTQYVSNFGFFDFEEVKRITYGEMLNIERSTRGLHSVSPFWKTICSNDNSELLEHVNGTELLYWNGRTFHYTGVKKHTSWEQPIVNASNTN